MFAFDQPSSGAASRVSAASIAEMIRHLCDEGPAGGDDADLIAEIGLLETLKSVVAAAQARRTAVFAASREAELAQMVSEPVRAQARRDQARRDIGAQIGLARRIGPRRGSQMVGLAKILTSEMPHLMGAFRRGAVDEYQAILVTAETSTLSLEHRQQVDLELAGKYGSMTPVRAAATAAAIGYRLDPEQAVKRLRKGTADRRVTLRPAPDTMTYLTALLPMAEGVAVHTALTRYAATATALGDPRGKGALMADELVACLMTAGTRGAARRPTVDEPSAPGTRHDGRNETDCGTTYVAAARPNSNQTQDADGEVDHSPDDIETGIHLTEGLPGVPAGAGIEIQLIMTDRTLFDGDMEPALLTGYGPIPAPLARHLIRGATDNTTTWVRRLYTDPHSGRLTGADPRRRLFSHTDRQFLITRDQVCRTPWCDAPIRHADHTQPHASGGLTTIDNGAGLCAACNQTKEHPGWTSETTDDGTILTTTPTGHRYVSRPPDAPRSAPWADHPAWTASVA